MSTYRYILAISEKKMPTLSISLPDQLKTWVSQQVSVGRYSSASDYLRDLIREEQQDLQWLANKLNPLLETPAQHFVSVTADDVKVSETLQVLTMLYDSMDITNKLREILQQLA